MKNLVSNHGVKIAFLLGIIIFLIGIIPFTNSKYESTTVSKVNNLAAIYLYKEDYITKQINLGTLVPSTSKYEYSFTISNFEKEKRTEVSIEYDIKFRITTNLPLRYTMYLNGDTSNNLFDDSKIEADEDGTYFIHLDMPKRYFGHMQNEQDTFNLKVEFPYEYKDAKYQDLIELFEISVDSKQRI